MTGFIDIHCHILPGLDDGPESMDESLEMVKMAVNNGTSHIFCTPHVYPEVYDTNTDSIKRARDELKNRVSNGVKLFFGGDVRIMPDLVERLARQEVPTLNGSPYLLVEFPSQIIPPYTSRLIFNLRRNGLIPIVTHPERCAYFAKDFTGLKVLREQGCMFQLTAMSLLKDAGKEVRKNTLAMIEKGFADFIASDAHSTGHRTPVLSKAYDEVQRQFGKDLTEKIFFENPQKILDSVTE
jgi:protein-tyrosine phosphatase